MNELLVFLAGVLLIVIGTFLLRVGILMIEWVFSQFNNWLEGKN